MSGPRNNTNELLVNFLGQLGNVGLTGLTSLGNTNVNGMLPTSFVHSSAIGPSNISPGFVQQSTQPTTYYPGLIYYTPITYVPPPPGLITHSPNNISSNISFWDQPNRPPGQATTLPQAFTIGTLHDPTTGAWNMDTCVHVVEEYGRLHEELKLKRRNNSNSELPDTCSMFWS
ncbi:hypothetical protein Tco_0651025 [Tanacetum coccineum]